MNEIERKSAMARNAKSSGSERQERHRSEDVLSLGLIASSPTVEIATPTVQSVILDSYDATPIIGLRTIVRNAVIETTDEDGEVSIEIPLQRQLLAAAAVARCLMPIRLRGWELKAMRKIMRLTLNELAKMLDEKTAPETLSRWESEAQPIGGYVEKLLRLLVCETLSSQAPGVDYSAKKIAEMHLVDPWRSEPGFEVPHIEMAAVRVKESSGSVVDGWDVKKAA
jgi:DNA-binding transcriptional regulator YiaG